MWISKRQWTRDGISVDISFNIYRGGHCKLHCIDIVLTSGLRLMVWLGLGVNKTPLGFSWKSDWCLTRQQLILVECIFFFFNPSHWYWCNKTNFWLYWYQRKRTIHPFLIPHGFIIVSINFCFRFSFDNLLQFNTYLVTIVYEINNYLIEFVVGFVVRSVETSDGNLEICLNYNYFWNFFIWFSHSIQFEFLKLIIQKLMKIMNEKKKTVERVPLRSMQNIMILENRQKM